MSIAQQITRIQTDRNTIRTKLVALGLATSTDNLDTLASAISNITNVGAVTATVKEGDTYTIPKGYHSGAGTVSGIAGGGNYSLQSKSGTVTIPASYTEDRTYTQADFAIDPDWDPPYESSIQEGTNVFYLTYPIDSIMVYTVDENGEAVTDAYTGDWYITDDGGIRFSGPPTGSYDYTDNITLRFEYNTDNTKYSGIIPSKQAITVTPDSGYYGLSDVTIAPIPDIYQDVSGVTANAGSVLVGKSFVSSTGAVVQGTMSSHRDIIKILTADDAVYDIPKGYHDGNGMVYINPQDKSITPTVETRTVRADAGNVLNEVTINPIPDEYQDVSGVTATANTVLEGSTFVDSEGNVIDGAIKTHGFNVTLTPLSPSYAIDQMDGTPGLFAPNGSEVKIARKDITITPTKETITEYDGDNGDGGYFINSVTVNPIPAAYQDVTQVTATAEDVLSTKKIVAADGTVVTGLMANNGKFDKVLDASAGNQSATIPAGYHNGTGKITIDLEEKPVTPTKSEQNITPSAGKVLSKVTVAAIPAAYQDVSGVTAAAGDVLSGKKIVTSNGTVVTGSMTNNGAVKAIVDAYENLSYTVPKGYHDGTGTVSVDMEEVVLTPSKAGNYREASAGKVISKVTVNPIPAAYQDVTGVTATAGTVLAGSKYVDSSGTLVTGTMANNGAVSKTIDGLTATSVSIPAGYTTGGTVSLTSDIEDALAAI